MIDSNLELSQSTPKNKKKLRIKKKIHNKNPSESIQTTGLKRSTIDKYYTSLDTVEICRDHIIKYINIDKMDLIIEPSAGNGSFINTIKQLSNNYIFYDIEPEHLEIQKINYLEIDESIFINYKKKIHIIGNPPFGRQSSLAIKFIKKSVKFCDSISFILPKSFKKDSLKRHMPLNFHLVFQEDILEDAFIVNNNKYSVPCVFQADQKVIIVL